MQKIMFTKGLTQAVLEGLKTNTRRIIKVPDTWHGIDVYGVGPDTDKQSLLLYDADEFLIEDPKTHLCGQIMPKYKVGEVVAVAQSYREIEKEIEREGLPLTLKDSILKTPGYRNKMYVRAELMPHQIKITGRHAELLQDISDEDCLREGISFVNGRFYIGYLKTTGQRIWLDGDTPREAFAYLIDKVSGKGTWESNPWVYAYEFEKVR